MQTLVLCLSISVTDNLMFHLDLYNRDSKNIKIPGSSVSEKLADSDSEFPSGKYGKDTSTKFL